jgi:hypothetical protein
MILDYSKKKLTGTGFFLIFYWILDTLVFPEHWNRLISNQSTSDTKLRQLQMLTRAETLDLNCSVFTAKIVATHNCYA